MVLSRGLLFNRNDDLDLGENLDRVPAKSGLPSTVWQDEGHFELYCFNRRSAVSNARCNDGGSLGGIFKGAEIPAELIRKDQPERTVIGPPGVAHVNLTGGRVGPEGQSAELSDRPIRSRVGYFKSICRAAHSDWVKAVGKIEKVGEAVPVGVIVVGTITCVVGTPEVCQPPRLPKRKRVSGGPDVIKEDSSGFCYWISASPDNPENDLGNRSGTASIGQFAGSGIGGRICSEGIPFDLYTVSGACLLYTSDAADE